MDGDLLEEAPMGAMESRHGGGQPFVRWLSAAAAGMVRRAGMGLALSLLTAGSLAALPAATASAQPGPEYAVGVVGTDGALWAQAPVLGPGWHRLGGHLIASPAIAAVPTTSGSTRFSSRLAPITSSGCALSAAAGPHSGPHTASGRHRPWWPNRWC